MVSSRFHSLQGGAISKLQGLKCKVASKFYLEKRQDQNIFNDPSKEIKAESSAIEPALEDSFLLDVSGTTSDRVCLSVVNESHKSFDGVNKIPKGARVVSITVREGQIVEKVYLTVDEKLIFGRIFMGKSPRRRRGGKKWVFGL